MTMMKNKGIVMILALMLGMGALLLPLTVYAASGSADTTPPTVAAGLEDGTLRVEAKDRHSGVEAVYVNGHRFNYLVNGVLEVVFDDYHDGGEFANIYAVDYAGNKSNTIQVRNPAFVSPTPQQPTTSEPVTNPSVPAPVSSSSSAAPASSSQSQSQSQPAASSSSQSQSTASSSSIPASSTSTSVSQPDEAPAALDPNAFSPEGNAEVTNNATGEEGKEFFIFTTPDGNVFYLVIDRQREGQNVYLLDGVTEADLIALAAANGTVPVVVEPEPEPVTPTEPADDSEPEDEAPAQKGGSNIVFILLAVAALGGAAYYIKIVRPKQQAQNTTDFEGYGDEDDEADSEDDDIDIDEEILLEGPEDDEPDEEMEDGEDE